MALNGKADLIVTGDADLLVLDPFQGIPILTARRFVEAGPDRPARHAAQWKLTTSAGFATSTLVVNVPRVARKR